jgi:wyosine [tRNA(Phe)-imidazoG37] synthetase (radical SAM superfamily)
MCIQSSAEKYKYSYDEKLPYETFKDIMKEAKTHYCPSLTIAGTSEPTLDSRLSDMIALANKNGFIAKILL